MDDSDVKLDTKKLDQLIRALKANLPRAKVGILGTKGLRSNSKVGETNASIGAIHEFGSSKVPQRSFLRVPIAEHLAKYLENDKMLGPDELNLVIKEADVTPWVKRVAVIAERIVREAFATSGFGKWPQWKTPNYKNGQNRLLEDTGQLRDSISSEVK